jgi:hypothetical protein
MAARRRTGRLFPVYSDTMRFGLASTSTRVRKTSPSFRKILCETRFVLLMINSRTSSLMKSRPPAQTIVNVVHHPMNTSLSCCGRQISNLGILMQRDSKLVQAKGDPRYNEPTDSEAGWLVLPNPGCHRPPSTHDAVVAPPANAQTIHRAEQEDNMSEGLSDAPHSRTTGIYSQTQKHS